ncbi:MAG TPA: phytoene desaturase family protein [Flavitalea sp.]|nr:phytoene desaturase family protein [Flavitalea sp.]
MSKKAVVIGSGFAGLSAASFLAKAGWQVTVLEKQSTAGGRARQLKSDGFTFDMGPSWYWMPDVFEHYFNQFGYQVKDFYSLTRLDPSYRVYWESDFDDIPADLSSLTNFFESLESGSGKKLHAFLAEAEFKYKTGMQQLVYKPGRSLLEFADWNVLKGMLRLDVFTSIRKHIRKRFKNERIRQLLEFPVLFLGALPQNTPALYSLMNYADLVGGTWYPSGGMYSIVEAMQKVAVNLGVSFHFNQTASEIKVAGDHAESVITGTATYDADVVVAAADYHHVETDLLQKSSRSYTETYWDSRQLAPSCLLYYIGLNRKLKNVAHHSLFFDTSFEKHGKEIYASKEWPADPLFYVNIPSVTDSACCSPGHENLMFLIPVASGLTDDDETKRDFYFRKIIKRFENRIGQNVSDAIIFQKSFACSDFVNEYNSFKGNAYGLANTLSQTALLKPSCRSRKIGNLFFAGQLTVPGPGVPPALISGEVVASEVLKFF